MLAAGVGAGTLLLGGALAALVSFYDFPGRRWLDWALVLPLAMPAYVLVFVLLGQYDEASALQRALRGVLGEAFQLPEVRSTVGTIVGADARPLPVRLRRSAARRSSSSRATRSRRRGRSG